jgi:phage terminase large subunit-like protein
LTISPSAVLLGAQRPRVSSVPACVSSAGVEAVELAASAGLILDDWQAHVLEGALGERADGKWSAFEVGLIVGRQNGKGSVLEARELAGLFLFGEMLILHSAHEFKTAQEAFRRVLGLIQNTPDLDRLVARVRTSHGEEGIELRSGARLRFVARSTGSGRGFSGDVVILDEAYNLPGSAMGALLPTMAARPNPQVWYASSAGKDDSEVLARVRDRGKEGTSPRLAYFEWSAPSDADLDDPAAWQARIRAWAFASTPSS